MAFLGLNSPFKVSLFISYILLWTVQGLYVHGLSVYSIKFNAKSLVFIQDLSKLLLTLIVFLLTTPLPIYTPLPTENNNNKDPITDNVKIKSRMNTPETSPSRPENGGITSSPIVTSKMSLLIDHLSRSVHPLLVLYFLPAVLYVCYNTLTFFLLGVFDPATYFTLLQIKLVLTAVCSKILLSKSFSSAQWSALVLITFGCMVKEVQTNSDDTTSSHLLFKSERFFHLSLMVLQAFLSAFAGVYNEFLLKRYGKSACPAIQNFWMYFDSLTVNFMYFVMHGLYTHDNIFVIFTNFFSTLINNVNKYTIFFILNSAILGVVTGYLLHRLDAILKVIASAIELWTTAIFSAIIFHTELSISSSIGMVFVTAGVYLYGASSDQPAGQHSHTVSTVENTTTSEVELADLVNDNE